MRVDERREKKSDVAKVERARRGKAGGGRGERDAAKVRESRENETCCESRAGVEAGRRKRVKRDYAKVRGGEKESAWCECILLYVPTTRCAHYEMYIGKKKLAQLSATILYNNN